MLSKVFKLSKQSYCTAFLTMTNRGAVSSFTSRGDVRRSEPSRASLHSALFILRPGRTQATTLLSVQPMKIGLLQSPSILWVDNILWKYITVTNQKIPKDVESVSYGCGRLCHISGFCLSSLLPSFIVALFWAAAIFNRLVLHSPSLCSEARLRWKC